MIPYCDTPAQSLLSALFAGLLGGGLGLWLGLALPATVLLAGALGGLGDLLAHVVRGDAQLRAAVGTLR